LLPPKGGFHRACEGEARSAVLCVNSDNALVVVFLLPPKVRFHRACEGEARSAVLCVNSDNALVIAVVCVLICHIGLSYWQVVVFCL